MKEFFVLIVCGFPIEVEFPHGIEEEFLLTKWILKGDLIKLEIFFLNGVTGCPVGANETFHKEKLIGPLNKLKRYRYVYKLDFNREKR